MKITNKSGTGKKITITIIIVSLLAVGSGVAYVLFSSQKSTAQSTVSTTNLNPATEDQIKAGNDAKSQTVNSADSDGTKGDQTDSSSSDLKITITAANQVSNLLQIRTLIEPVVSSTAVCTLTMTKQTESVTQTSDTQALASNSTCKGFNVETSNLSKGDWTLTIKITDGTESNSVSRTITLT